MCSIRKAPSTTKTIHHDQARSTSSMALITAGVAGVYICGGWFSIATAWSVLCKGVAALLGFLAILVCFIQYYVGQDLRQCSPLTEHLASSAEPNPVDCLDDLDKVANPEGLAKMWHDEVQMKETNLNVLLTGVTGYVGRAFLFQLLREISNAESNGQKKLKHKVYVMLRARKGHVATNRLLKLRDEKMFITVRKQWDNAVVVVESGDLQEDFCGMTQSTLDALKASKITHVVHCAADVNFNRPLADSAGINISPALQLQNLAKTWSSCKRFVHCSTAFVNPGHGSEQEPMAEILFPLGDYDPQELYESMRGDQKLALKAKEEMKFPNNYVFTKCVGEHLVSRGNSNMELKIVRPAIVGPAWVLPEPAWNGDKPSTVTALMLLWGTRVVRFAHLSSRPIPMIPVDVVVVGLMCAMISPEELKEQEVDLRVPSIRNLIWSHTSSDKCISALEMAKRCIHAAVLKQHFSVTETAVSYALIDFVYKIPVLFSVLHFIFNLGPLYILQFTCWSAKHLGIQSILDQLPVTKLLKFSDMLTLYEPYMGRDYYFASALSVPKSLDANKYCISVFSATHSFWAKLFPGTIEDLHELDLLPKRRWDLWWALTQPCSSFKQRIIGYLACKVLRTTFSSVKFDIKSLADIARALSDKQQAVVLAPSISSLTACLLTKYMTFAMAAIGIDASNTVGVYLGETDQNMLRDIVDESKDQEKVVIPLGLDYHVADIHEDLRPKSFGIPELAKLIFDTTLLGRKGERLGDVLLSFGKPVQFTKSSDIETVMRQVKLEHQRISSGPTIAQFAAKPTSKDVDMDGETQPDEDTATECSDSDLSDFSKTRPDCGNYIKDGMLNEATVPSRSVLIH